MASSTDTVVDSPSRTPDPHGPLQSVAPTAADPRGGHEDDALQLGLTALQDVADHVEAHGDSDELRDARDRLGEQIAVLRRALLARRGDRA